MRIVLEIEGKYVSIEIGDVEPDEEPATVIEVDGERLPIGFQPPPNVDPEEIEEDEDETSPDTD